VTGALPKIKFGDPPGTLALLPFTLHGFTAALTVAMSAGWLRSNVREGNSTSRTSCLNTIRQVSARSFHHHLTAWADKIGKEVNLMEESMLRTVSSFGDSVMIVMPFVAAEIV